MCVPDPLPDPAFPLYLYADDFYTAVILSKENESDSELLTLVVPGLGFTRSKTYTGAVISKGGKKIPALGCWRRSLVFENCTAFPVSNFIRCSRGFMAIRTIRLACLLPAASFIRQVHT